MSGTRHGACRSRTRAPAEPQPQRAQLGSPPGRAEQEAWSGVGASASRLWSRPPPFPSESIQPSTLFSRASLFVPRLCRGIPIWSRRGRWLRTRRIHHPSTNPTNEAKATSEHRPIHPRSRSLNLIADKRRSQGCKQARSGASEQLPANKGA